MKPMTEPEESTRLAISPKGAPGQVFGAGNPIRGAKCNKAQPDG